MAITINGDGTLTGVSVGGLPDGIVDTDMLATDAVSAAKLQSNAIAAGDLPAGSILQVVQSVKSDTFTTTSTSAVTTGLTAAITPTASGNKVLVTISGFFQNTLANYTTFIYLYKGGSVVSGATGDAAGSRIRATIGRRQAGTGGADASSFTYLDTTSGTSEITYQVYMSAENTSTAVMGRTGADGNSAGYPRCPVTLTLLEVAA